MQTSNRHSAKRTIFGVLCAALLGGSLFAGSAKSVFADTIGDVLNNDAMKVVTDSSTGISSVETTDQSYSGASAGTIWSMYQIPGLGRFRKPDEGSFVKWGYNGWSNAGGTPLATDISGSSTSAQDKVNQTTRDWQNKTTESPVAITFKTQGDGKHGQAYFSLNYVDKDNLVDFGSDNDAATISQAWAGQTTNELTASQRAKIFNPTGVSSKMKSSNGNTSGTPLLDSSKQSFNGGYLQATGNVPIAATVAQSKSLVDASMAGDWAVMVKVHVAKGIDAKALAASINWNKSYYYLTVDSVPISVLGFNLYQVTNLNFPLQFDHHVYLDPNDDPQHPQNFFLKVKGIPFWFIQKEMVWSLLGKKIDGSSQLQLQNGNSDYVDYLHNRYISDNNATTLDLLGKSSSNWPYPTGSASSDLNDGNLITKDPLTGNIQPDFTTQPSPSRIDNIGNPLWSAYDLYPTLTPPWHTLGKSAVMEAGQVGQMIAMLNNVGNNKISSRDTGGGSLYAQVLSSISTFFATKPFTGSAHINFSFDMSKYEAGTSKEEQALTRGRLFAAPNSNGTFNSATGKSATDAIQITMFDSSELVDPYSLTTNSKLDREDDSANSALRNQLNIVQSSQNGQSKQSGMTPADYAVINKNAVNTGGTRYPTYTNFTSWTGAIVPYDRMHWDDNDDKSDSTFTDTLHSDGKLGTDIKNRTATPDPANDGLLANDGSQFIIKKQGDSNTVGTFKYEEGTYKPVFDSSGTLQQAGVIRPQRYANVYQLYDYSQSTPTVDVHVDDYDKDKPQVGAGTSPAPASGVNVTGKTITSDLNGQKWHYTGAMNSGTGLPLADATIDLTQMFNPTLNLSLQKLINVPYSRVAGKNHFIQQLGSWRDPLSFVKNDTLLMNFNGFSSEQKAITSALGGNTDTHTVTGDWSESNAFSHTTYTSVMNVDGNQNVTPEFQLPVENNKNDNFFFGDGTLTRNNADVKLTNNYTLASGVDDTASDNYFLLLDRDTPSDRWYDAKKVFQESSTETDTVHYLKSGQTSVHVVVNVTRQANANTPDETDLIVRVPVVQKDKNNVGATVANFAVTATDTGNSVKIGDAGDPSGSWQAENFTSKKLSFTTPPQKFTYEYDYTFTNQDDIPLLTQYQDLIMDSNGKTRAISNGVQFDKLKSANLIHVPSFDFGTNSIPNGQTTYGLTDSDRAKDSTDSYFTVQSNNNNTSNWTLFDTLNGFNNLDGSSSHGDFTLALGWPETYNTATQKFANEGGMTDPKGIPTSQYTDDNWRYVNHYPFALISNGHQNQLYRLDRTYGDKDNKETNLTRYYTGATLTVPAGETPSITSGKYTANLTYMLSDDGTLN